MPNKCVFSPDQILSSPSLFGTKTIRLAECLDAGLNVPPFVAIPCTHVTRILVEDAFRSEVAETIRALLKTPRYAVRSSGLVEDGKKQSWAGIFKSEINLPPEDLSGGMKSVVQHAQAVLKGNLAHFSLLIQEFIDPEISGVTFTRDPLGGREAVLELFSGRGEKIVGGEIKPRQIRFFWMKGPSPALEGVPGLNEWHQHFKKIEDRYRFPQDIEWCVKQDRFYLLQTRPITTLTPLQWEGIQYLDTFLPRAPFFFEKTELTEIAPQPTPFTLSLLQRIYAAGGPISAVYHRFGIHYDDTNFLKIVGNTLYVDKERELKSLLPSYSCLNMDHHPSFSSFSGIGTTIKNIFALTRLPIKNTPHEWYEKINQKLCAEADPRQSPAAWLSQFLQDYQLVFEINLMATSLFALLKSRLKGEEIKIEELLSSKAPGLSDFPEETFFPSEGFKGNSLEISDESPFESPCKLYVKEKPKAMNWWRGLSSPRKEKLGPIWRQSLEFQRLRELGRCLVVKEISPFREFLLDLALKKSFKLPQTLFYSTMEEILSGQLDEKRCLERKAEYVKYNGFQFPPSLSNEIRPVSNSMTAISPGVAFGRLVTQDLLPALPSSQKYILLTPVLSADLIRFFDRIVGIVSETGGLLSHLAILARERGIPVISGADSTLNSWLNKNICIDGEKAVLSIVSEASS